MKHLGIVLLVVTFCSCLRRDSPTSVLEKERFEAAYIELLDSAQVIQTAPTDSTVSPVAERILKRHNATLDQFKATVKDYNADSKRWKEFYENIVKRMDERAQKNTPPSVSNPR